MVTSNAVIQFMPFRTVRVALALFITSAFVVGCHCHRYQTFPAREPAPTHTALTNYTGVSVTNVIFTTNISQFVMTNPVPAQVSVTNYVNIYEDTRMIFDGNSPYASNPTNFEQIQTNFPVAVTKSAAWPAFWGTLSNALERGTDPNFIKAITSFLKEVDQIGDKTVVKTKDQIIDAAIHSCQTIVGSWLVRRPSAGYNGEELEKILSKQISALLTEIKNLNGPNANAAAALTNQMNSVQGQLAAIKAEFSRVEAAKTNDNARIPIFPDNRPNGWSVIPSLVPSVLWIGLIVAAGLLYRTEVNDVIGHFNRRLRSGASVKLGTVELGAVRATDQPLDSRIAISQDAAASKARADERNAIYAASRGAMLVHQLYRSETAGEHYDILIYLVPKRNSSLIQVTHVEYFLGSYGWGNRIFRSSDRAHGFSLFTSAYGPFLCTARVYFNDRSYQLISRYIDFEMGAYAPFLEKESPSKRRNDKEDD